MLKNSHYQFLCVMLINSGLTSQTNMATLDQLFKGNIFKIVIYTSKHKNLMTTKDVALHYYVKMQ